jgi:CII-binding regulator of phage lambda lysogenization HflD
MSSPGAIDSALGGVFLAAVLVDKIAKTGQATKPA